MAAAPFDYRLNEKPREKPETRQERWERQRKEAFQKDLATATGKAGNLAKMD